MFLYGAGSAMLGNDASTSSAILTHESCRGVVITDSGLQSISQVWEAAQKDVPHLLVGRLGPDALHSAEQPSTICTAGDKTAGCFRCATDAES